MESTLSSPCFRSDPPFSLQDAALVHLDSFPHHNLVICTDGPVPFPFGKGGFSVLANRSLCGTDATISFYASSVCSSFLTEACAILQLLSWSRQHQLVCHYSFLFLLSDSRSVLTTLSSPPSFLLPQTLWQILKEPSPLLSGYDGSLDINFSRETTRPMSWTDRERYSCALRCLVVCLLLPLVSTLVFSQTGSVLSHLNSLTRRSLRFPLRNLCFLVTLAALSLSSLLQRTQPSVEL